MVLSIRLSAQVSFKLIKFPLETIMDKTMRHAQNRPPAAKGFQG